MNITKNQTKLLLAFSKNDHVRDDGWDSEDAAAWTDCLMDDMSREGIEKASHGGVLNKAEEAGLLITYGEINERVTILTDIGRKELAKIVE